MMMMRVWRPWHHHEWQEIQHPGHYQGAGQGGCEETGEGEGWIWPREVSERHLMMMPAVLHAAASESHLCILIISDVWWEKSFQTPIISNCNISGRHLYLWLLLRRPGLRRRVKNSANVFRAAKRAVYLVLASPNVWVIMSEKWYIDQICCGSILKRCCCCCCCCNGCWILNAICKRKQQRRLLQI